jgi:hypothetical protein
MGCKNKAKTYRTKLKNDTTFSLQHHPLSPQNLFMRIFIFPALFFVLSLLACRNKNKVEIKDGKVGITDAIEAAQQMSENMSNAQDRWEERRKKGDTVALQYKELETFLPDVSGYTKDGGPKGQQMNTPGLGSWSQSEQSYTNGDKSLKISITDYNASQAGFTMATALFNLNISAEDDEKRQGSVDLGMKNVAAYETVYKQRPEASLVVVAGDRFYVNIESNGSNDIDALKTTAKNIVSNLSSKY